MLILGEGRVKAVLFENTLENLDEERVLDFLGGRVWTAQAKKAKFRNVPILYKVLIFFVSFFLSRKKMKVGEKLLSLNPKYCPN